MIVGSGIFAGASPAGRSPARAREQRLDRQLTPLFHGIARICACAVPRSLYCERSPTASALHVRCHSQSIVPELDRALAIASLSTAILESCWCDPIENIDGGEN